jgi:Suppressor of fused protein (SUFU)
VDRYSNHLDMLAAGQERSIFMPIGSTTPGLPPVASIVYRDLPEPGMLTSFTYGLSLASHPNWVYGRPELCISVNSDDLRWATAMALLAERMRGDCPFSYGDIIGFGETISEESPMTDFVVFAPAAIDPDGWTVDMGEELPIHIAGLYPIHASERRFIRDNGLEAFWHLADWDPYDVRREPIT